MYEAIELEVHEPGRSMRRAVLSSAVNQIGSMGDELELEDDDIEITHCYVYLVPEGAKLVADDDDNPTLLNGVPIKQAELLKVGDEIGLGSTRLVVTGMIPTGQRRHEARYASIKLLDQCPHCGDGMPINGLVDELTCGSCSRTVSPGDDYWKMVLEDVDNDFYTGGSSHTINFRTRVRWTAEKPKCVKCEAELPVDQVAPGDDGDITCTSCGAANSTYPASARFTGIIPSLQQVYCGRRYRGGNEGPAAEIKPVVLSCPECRASLKVTARSERTVTCGHCGVDVFLPEELWRRVHPSDTARVWYLRFEGPSLKEIEELAERPKKIAEAEERLESRQEMQRAERRANWAGRIGIAVGIAVPVIALVFGLGSALFSGTGAPSGRTDLQPVTQAITYSGTVTWASGNAAVAFGTPCMVSVVPNPSFPNSPFNCHVRVQCGATTLYGWQNYGYTECDVQGGMPTRAADPRGTAEEGDPKLELDVPARMVRVYDDDPGRTYEIRVAW